MIKYTTKDIITRAAQLSDLENSDFISDSEKFSLLNEAWVQLYQQLVNANDKTFIKTVYASNGMILPKDFYSLSALYCELDKEQIQKLNAVQKTGYDIRNNTLYLSSEYDDVSVLMEYYPAPKTLYFSSGKKVLRSFVKNPIMIIDDQFFLDSEGGIFDNSGEQIGTSSLNGLKVANGVLAHTGTFYDYLGNEIESKTSEPFLIKGNEVAYDDVISEKDLSGYLAVITDKSEEQFFYIDRELKVYDKDFNFLDLTLSDNSLIFCRQDGLYFSENYSNKIERQCGPVRESFPLGLARFCCFVDDLSCIVSINNNSYEMSYGFNSLLLYPNNMYYVVLSYMLAISFKLKQQGDVSVLTAKYNEAVKQFIDSVNRDNNANYTIKNVYSRSHLW